MRGLPERDRVVRGMQDSKSLDELSGAYGGGLRGAARGGQVEGRRATISSALELEGTVSQEGDITNFICKNLEQKIKMSSRPSLDCDCKRERDSVCVFPILHKLIVFFLLFQFIFISSDVESTVCWGEKTMFGVFFGIDHLHSLSSGFAI